MTTIKNVINTILLAIVVYNLLKMMAAVNDANNALQSILGR